MTETTRDFTALKLASADPSVLRDLPAGAVIDLRVKGATGTTGSNWIATLGLKRVG